MALIRDRTTGGPHRAEARLDSPDAADRREAVRNMPDTPECVAILAHRVEVEPDPSTRQLILTTLAGRQRPEVVRALLPYLGSDDAAVRTSVAETLASMPGVVATEIPGLLHADDHDVRIMTVMLLGQLPHQMVPEWLAEVARNDRNANVVGCALSELVRLDPARDLEVFADAAVRFPDDPFIAFMATAVRHGEPR